MSSTTSRVTACITAYGNTGPKANHAAYDSVIQAWSGLMSVTGTPETAPLKAGPPIVDYSTGIAAAFAVATALYQRTLTGKGQYIDLSMLDTMLMLMASVTTAYLNTGVAPKPAGNDAASRAPASTTFNTADGLIAFAINEEHQYQHLIEGIGLTRLNDDPRFATGKARRENVPALRAEIQQALMAKSAVEWERHLNERGVPAGRVRTIADCLGDAQVASRGLYHTFSAAESGLDRELTIPLTPFRLAHGGAQARTPPKPLGADSDGILAALGYDRQAIAKLREARVV